MTEKEKSFRSGFRKLKANNQGKELFAMNSISNVQHGYKSEYYCTGCRFLTEEKFPKGQTALICGNEEESGCKCRVLGVYADSFLKTAREYQLKPAWCWGGKYLPETEVEA